MNNTTYDQIKTSRRLTGIGIGLGYAMAVAIAVINLTTSDGTPFTALAFLATMSLPSTMALVSLDRRPALLTAASMSALLLGVITLTSGVGVILIVVGVLWALAIRRRPSATSPDPRWAALTRPAIAALTVVPLLAMSSHLDPMCTVTNSEGTVIEVEAQASARSGWTLPFGGTTSGSSVSEEGQTETCASDTVRPWEAGLSILISIALVGIASRWPTNDELLAGESLPAEAQP